MAKREFLIVIALASLIYCSELEDVEQKKRGIGKATALNSVPTGAQKQEYSYSVYSPNINSQSSSSQSYKNQVSSSFYPNQASNQYYSSSNPSTDAPSSYSSQQHVSPQSSSHFVPLNFIPTQGYQTKYQGVPSKPPNVQLAILQQPNTYPSQGILPYHQLAHTLFALNPANQVQQHQGHPIPQFNVASNYQPLQLGSPHLSQPSMVVLAQPNPSIYSNLLYPNPIQNLYNYNPSNSQNKYSTYPSTQTEFEKYQGSVSQNVPKDYNEVGTQNADYTSSSDSNSSYKTPYNSRTSYGKLQ